MQLIKITRMFGLLVFACLPALADFDQDEADTKPKSGEQWQTGANEHLKSHQQWKAYSREFERFYAEKNFPAAYQAAKKSAAIADHHSSENHAANILSQSNLAQAESQGAATGIGMRRCSGEAAGKIGGIIDRFSKCDSGPDARVRQDERVRQEAIQRYQKTLAIQEKLLGPNHPSLVKNLLGLGDTYRNLKQDMAAKVPYQRALAILTRKGSDPKKVSDLLENLAYLYRMEGDMNRAVLYFERSLIAKIKALGSNHADLVGPLRNLSGLYVVLKRDKESEQLERRAARIEAMRR